MPVTSAGARARARRPARSSPSAEPEASVEPGLRSSMAIAAAGSIGDTTPRVAMMCVGVMCACAFASNLCVSLVGPFLPSRLEADGWSETVVGLVIAAYPATIVLINPIASPTVQRVGRAFSAALGMTTLAVGVACFGAAGGRGAAAALSPRGVLGAMIAARCFAAIGAATANIALTSATMDLYATSGSLATVLAVNEVAISLGFMLGPVAGGALFEAGGFTLPFFISAGLVLLGMPLSLAVLSQLPRKGNGSGGSASEPLLTADDVVNGDGDNGQLLTPRTLSRAQKLKMAVAAGSAFMCVLCFAEFNVLLEDYAEQALDMKTTAISALFAGLSLSYSLAAPLAGRATDMYGARGPMVAGLLVSALGRAVVICPGQASIARAVGTSEVRVRTVSASAGLTLFGLGQSFCLVPSLPSMKAVAGDYPSESVVSAFYMSLSAAEAIGSMVAGALGEAVGFSWTFAIFGGLTAAYALAVVATGPFEPPARSDVGSDEEMAMDAPVGAPGRTTAMRWRAATIATISAQRIRSAHLQGAHMRYAHLSPCSSLGGASLCRNLSTTPSETPSDRGDARISDSLYNN